MEAEQLFILSGLGISSKLILWNALGIKKENKVLKNISIFILLSIIIVLTNPMNLYISVAINYLSLIMCIKITFNRRFINVIYESCIVELINSYIQLISTIPAILIFKLTKEKYYFEEVFLIAIVTLATSIIIYKYVQLAKIIKMFNCSKRRIHVLLVNILIYVLIYKVLWDYNKDLIVNYIILFIAILVILILINVMYLRYSFKINEQKKTIKMYEKYYPKILNLIDEVRRRQHEFKNHINAIYGISEVSNNEEMKGNIQTYIASLNKSFKNIEKLVFINNKMLSAVIYCKICEAEEKSINITYDLQLENQNFIMKNYELTEMIANLLDNAFEAVSRQEVNERKVSIVITNKKESFYLEVKNKGEPIDPLNITKIFNKGFTTKGTEGRGYGLYNVKKIVECHNGEIQLSSDNEYNIFKIYFNKHSSISGSVEPK